MQHRQFLHFGDDRWFGALLLAKGITTLFHKKMLPIVHTFAQLFATSSLQGNPQEGVMNTVWKKDKPKPDKCL